MIIIDNTQRCLKFNENEMAVTWFFMTGMKIKQIAEWSGLSEKSISYYKRRVMKKVGVKNTNEFIIWFLANQSNYKQGEIEFAILRRRNQG